MLTDEQIDTISDPFERALGEIECDLGIHSDDIRAFAREIERAVLNETCKWSKNSILVPTYTMNCNQNPWPLGVDQKYCQFCGRKIEVV